ncbi:MAG: transposase [Ktedonobacterales bacterium]
MNSVVHEQTDRQILPVSPSEQAVVPVVLTAQTLLRSRGDIAAGLRQESYDLRHVATWNRLPEAIDRVQADVVLVDMDAVDLMCDGAQSMSGHRLVTLLARQLAQRPIALVVMTRLDFSEIEDLARAGVHAVVSPSTSAQSLIEQVRVALDSARKRCALRSAKMSGEDLPPQHCLPPVEQQLQGGDDNWRLPDELWHRIEELLPAVRHPERTRPIDRRALNAVFFVLRSGIPWSKLPKSLGCAATARERVQYWTACGIMEEMLAAGLAAMAGWEHLHWDRLSPTFPPSITHLAGCSAVTTDRTVPLPVAGAVATTGSRSRVAPDGKVMSRQQVAMPAS